MGKGLPKKRYFSFIVFALITLPLKDLLSRDYCPERIATGFGSSGAYTASLNHDGSMAFHFDGFEQIHFERVPKFIDEFSNVHLGSIARLSNVALINNEAQGGNHLLISDQRGILNFITSGGIIYKINPPNDSTVTAATLYTLPRSFMLKEILGISKIHAERLRSSLQQRTASKLLFLAEKQNRLDLLVAIGRQIYRSVVSRIELSDSEFDRSFFSALSNGPVKMLSRQSPEDPRHFSLTFEPLNLPILDFASESQENEIAVLESADSVLIFSPMKPVYTVPEKISMRAIDYLDRLDPQHVLLASENGQVVIVNLFNREIVATPKMNNGEWITSISGERLGSDFRVFATSAVQRKILYWDSSTGNGFEEFPIPFPGSMPVQIEAYTVPLPAGYSIGVNPNSRQSNEGFFTDIQLAGEVPYLSRLIALGADGQILGFRRQTIFSVSAKEQIPEWLPLYEPSGGTRDE